MKSSCRCLVFLALLALGALAQNMPAANGEFSPLESAVNEMLGGTYEGLSEKLVYRAGDSTALAIRHAIPDVANASEEQIRQSLNILKLAFINTKIITACSDREPKQTMLLLEQLQTVSTRDDLKAKIEETKASILKKTGSSLAGKSREEEKNLDFIKWLDALTQKASSSARPGMTRRELLKTFAEEGGISTRTHRQYVLMECPTIKVAVDFAPVGAPNHFAESLDDKIVAVSQPFLQAGIAD